MGRFIQTLDRTVRRRIQSDENSTRRIQIYSEEHSQRSRVKVNALWLDCGSLCEFMSTKMYSKAQNFDRKLFCTLNVKCYTHKNPRSNDDTRINSIKIRVINVSTIYKFDTNLFPFQRVVRRSKHERLL